MSYYGKYRAIVTNNKDPEKRGRIKVKCPSLLEDYESAWCMPCVPLLSNNRGIFQIPNVGDGVWIEFEEGNLTKPIYVGGWFNPNCQPQGSYDDVSNQLMIRTDKGKVIIQSAGGQVVIQGGNISASSITVSSVKTGSINTGSCNLDN